MLWSILCEIWVRGLILDEHLDFKSFIVCHRCLAKMPPGNKSHTQRKNGSGRVFVRTLRHRLQSAGLIVQRTVLPLTSRHCHERLEWCGALLNWRTEWLQSVLFYVFWFCLGASDAQILVRRRSGERLQELCIQPRHRNRRINVIGLGGYSPQKWDRRWYAIYCVSTPVSGALFQVPYFFHRL